MLHCLFSLALTSGPIREKLWMGHLAFCVSLAVSVVLLIWLSAPGAVERVAWTFPLRGRWLRRALEAALIASGGFCLLLLFTSGLGFFLFFPWLAR